jgi:hypothetical protein
MRQPTQNLYSAYFWHDGFGDEQHQAFANLMLAHSGSVTGSHAANLNVSANVRPILIELVIAGIPYVSVPITIGVLGYG